MGKMTIKAPRFDPSAEKVVIIAWKKKEGEYIKKDEELVEMMGEKTTFTYVSPCNGVVVKITVHEGEVDVGEPIGELECQD
jgi:2-oxoglutarate dehydrogenase E2 component (dihydrolipoamide succinyltransferase)